MACTTVAVRVVSISPLTSVLSDLCAHKAVLLLESCQIVCQGVWAISWLTGGNKFLVAVFKGVFNRLITVSSQTGVWNFYMLAAINL